MLSSAQIASLIAKNLGPQVLGTGAGTHEGLHPWIGVPAEHLFAVGQFVRDHPDIQLDMLRCITGLDYPDKRQMAVAYDLLSFSHLHEFCIKVFLPRDTPAVKSVVELWRAAEWHEREIFDLFGITFTGHPDPRRILLPDDWVGHPLRKDYVFPRDYHGIPGSVEMDWAQKPNYPK